jgi:outer membrane protein W
MNKNTKKILVLALGLIGAAQAHALEAKWDLGFGYDAGGDKLGTAFYTNGDSTNVNANQGAAFTVGAAIANDDAKQFETVASIGFKTGGPRAENGKVTFTSFPLTVMEYYRPSDVRLGVGLTYDMSPRFTVDAPNGSGTVDFDNALGAVAQIGWAPLAQRYSVDLRYTSMNFKTGNSAKVDGSSVGIYTSIRF